MRQFIFALSTLLWTPTAGAEVVAVFPPETINAAPNAGEVTGALMASSYAEVSGADVLSPTRTKTIWVGQGRNSVEAARVMNADQYILLRVIGLKTRIDVDATLYDQSGTKLHGAKLNGSTLDDLPIVIERIAQALHHRTDAKATRSVDSVTEAETAEPRRRKANRTEGFRTGVMFALADGEQFEPTIALAWEWRLELSRAFVGFGAGVLFPTGTSDLRKYWQGSVEINGGYIFTTGDVAPYIGLGVSPRIVHALNNTILGFAPHAELGLTILRTTNFRLNAALRAAYNVLPVREGGADTAPDVRPWETGLLVGLGW